MCARRAAGIDRRPGGLLIDTHGFVNVPDLTEALAAAADRRGAQFTLETRVVAIDSDPTDGSVVDTERGRVTAETVVMAAGSWTGQIAVADRGAVPDQAGARATAAPGVDHVQPLRHVLWGTECYIVPWSNGRVLVGATVEDAGFDERATAAGVRDLLDAACTLVPHLWQASFVEVRVGLRPACPMRCPWSAVPTTLPGLIYATGHYRNGVLLTPLTAALVSDLVFGSEDDDRRCKRCPLRDSG